MSSLPAHPLFLARRLNVRSILQEKSLFLFGPRQTGKSSLIRNDFADCRVYNLLDSRTFLDLSQRPSRIREELLPKDRIVVIDEIQRIPGLLNEAHLLIEERGVRFLLTGSSARKLRRGGVNLLGGRAWSRTLHPFVAEELQDFDLLRALNYGLLPPICFSKSPENELRAYVGDYLRQEIVAEALTRNVPAFSRFLEVAAACNSQIINYSAISNDAQVPKTTVYEYFQILRDTLLGWDVAPWLKSVKRKPITTAKFYFFDVGVARALQNRGQLKPRSPEFGEAMETYILHEIKTYLDYRGLDGPCYWRSTSGYEVDFILGDAVAVEVKAKSPVGQRDLRGVTALMEEKKLRRYIVVSLEERPRTVNGIEILPWRTFLRHLWDGNLLP